MTVRCFEHCMQLWKSNCVFCTLNVTIASYEGWRIRTLPEQYTVLLLLSDLDDRSIPVLLYCSSLVTQAVHKKNSPVSTAYTRVTISSKCWGFGLIRACSEMEDTIVLSAAHAHMYRRRVTSRSVRSVLHAVWSKSKLPWCICQQDRQLNHDGDGDGDRGNEKG